MPINAKYKAKYSYGNFYHVFNRASGNQLLFKDEKNYEYFLSKFDVYLGNYVILHAWCLIPNHFHLLIEIKEAHLLPEHEDIHDNITKRFKNFFLCYSLSYKIMFDQKANVFSQKYKHIQLYTDSNIRYVTLYIHRNPKHHNIADWQDYEWSSYPTIVNLNAKNKESSFLIQLFDNLEEFKQAHIFYIESSES